MSTPNRRRSRRALTPSPSGAPQCESLERRLVLAAPVVTGVQGALGMGRFIEGIEALNTFTATIADADNDVQRVEFVLGSRSSIDTDGSNGWKATFDMGELAGTASLLVTAVDAQDNPSPTTPFAITAVPRPDWLRDDELFNATGEVSGTQGYVVTINHGVGAGIEIPNFFPDALMGTQNFGATFSGSMLFTGALRHRVLIPFTGEAPRETGRSFVLSVIVFDQTIVERSHELTPGTTNWTIFRPSSREYNLRLDAASGNGEGVLNTGLSVPGFFGTGTVDLAMLPDLALTLDTRSHYQLIINPLAAPPIFVDEVNAYTPVEPLIAGIPLPIFGINIGLEISIDLELRCEGTFTSRYSAGEFSSQLTDFRARARFETGVIIAYNLGLTQEQKDIFGEITQSARIGIQVGGYQLFELVLEDTNLRGHYLAEPLVVSAYYRPRGSSTGARAGVYSFGSIEASDILATDWATKFTAPAPPVMNEYTPPHSVEETVTAAGDQTAVVGYLTEPTSDVPPVLYARFRQDDQFGQPQLITDSDHERYGLTMAFAGDTPFAMWGQSTLDRFAATQVPIEQAFGAHEIYWSRRVSGVWTTPAPITSDDKLDWRPSLAFNAAGTVGIAAWTHNQSAGSGFGGPTNEIYFARWDGAQWSAPVRLTTDADRDRPPSVVALPSGNFVISWTRTAGAADYLVYAEVAGASGALVDLDIALTAPVGTTLDGLATTAMSDGRVAFAWLEKPSGDASRLRTRFVTPSTDQLSDPQTVADARISSNVISIAERAGNLALTYCAAVPLAGASLASHVWVTYRNPGDAAGAWTRPVPLTQGERDHDAPSTAVLADGSLLVSFAAPDLLGEGAPLSPPRVGPALTDPNGTLASVVGNLADITIRAIDVDKPLARPGEITTLAATIYNAGAVPASFTIRIFDRGAEIAASPMILAPGESRVHAPVLFIERYNWSFTVVVDADNQVAEIDETNNSRTIASAAAPDPTAAFGSTPLGAADARGSHVVVGVNPSGQPIVFTQADAWAARGLNAGNLAGHIAIGNAIVWVDPKDDRAHAAVPTDFGLLLYTRAASGDWSVRNLTTETGAAFSPSFSLTQFASIAGTVVIAGLTEDGRLVAFQQTGAVDQGAYAYRFVDISADLESQGMQTPDFDTLISYIPTWDTWHLAGIDTAGRIQSVWINTHVEGFTKWRTDDLTAITGAPAVTGQLAVTLTTWGGINLTGLDNTGQLMTTWWVPSFEGAWRVDNLTTSVGGSPLAGGKVSAYTTPWGGLNYVGLDPDGRVTVYWWTPASTDWTVSPLLPADAPAANLPTGTLSSSSAADGTLNVYGTSSTGNILRLWWQPSGAPGWTVDNLTALAQQA